MLQVVTLALALATAQDSLTIKGELKEIPAQGKDAPVFSCEGTANLPDGVSLTAELHYDKVVPGKALFSDTAILKGGKFSQIFPVFSKRTFPGTYIAHLVYDAVLQNLNAPDYPRTAVDITLKLGGPQDLDREGKAVREELIGDIRAFLAIAEEIKKKVDEWRDKPQAEREAPVKEWLDRVFEIRQHADPRKHPEYYILRLNQIVDQMLEDQANVLMASARCFVLNQRENALEGLTRLRQTAEYWIGEIGNPRLQDLGSVAQNVDECRAILKKLLDKPDEPVLPARRRFLELTARLDKSVAPEFHELILKISDQAATFFNAVSDKSPETRDLHKGLDAALERLAAALRKS